MRGIFRETKEQFSYKTKGKTLENGLRKKQQKTQTSCFYLSLSFIRWWSFEVKETNTENEENKQLSNDQVSFIETKGKTQK